MEKCPDCKKWWNETWDETLYCPKCGQTKEQAMKKAARQSRPKQAPLPLPGPDPVEPKPEQVSTPVKRKANPHPSTPPPSPRQPSPPTNTNGSTVAEAAQFAIALVERVYADYSIPHLKTRITNAKSSSHRQHVATSKSEIRFGRRSLERALTTGFIEYKTLRYAWHGHGELVGMKGVWALTLHEAAHAIQGIDGMERDRAGRRIVHSDQFVDILWNLQEKYPYQDCTS